MGELEYEASIKEVSEALIVKKLCICINRETYKFKLDDFAD